MDELKYELQEETRKGARIKVIGIGGGGSNAVGRMYEEGLDGVEFYIMNTDAQALAASKVPNKIQIGAKVTDGLGSGSDPAVGRQAALEDTERILSILEGADLLFSDRRPRRRHRRGRGAGGRDAGQTARRADHRHRHQALHFRRRQAHAPGRAQRQ